MEKCSKLSERKKADTCVTKFYDCWMTISILITATRIKRKKIPAEVHNKSIGIYFI